MRDIVKEENPHDVVYLGDTIQSQIYYYSIDDEIAEPHQYRNLIQLLNTTTENDIIVLHINSPGGQVNTAIAIINAIKGSKATVVGTIDFDCCSAATAIFLSCDEHQWSEYVSFMIHEVHGGFVGKFSDVRRQSEHYQEVMEDFVVGSYSGFLTPDEITEVLSGKEMWFNSFELGKRIHEYYQYLKELDGETVAEVE